MPIPHAFRQPAGPGEERTGRYHPGSGSIYGFHHQNMFDRMKAHDFQSAREHNVYYPFSDREEWELSKFLVDNLNQGQINRFLKLLWVSKIYCHLCRVLVLILKMCIKVRSEARRPPQFKSAQQLMTFIDALPKGPKWRCTTIQIEGYITTHPVHLIWRDSLEVVRDIFGNPVFANDMEFDPYEIYVNGEPEYGEWMSSPRAHAIQVRNFFFCLQH